MLNHYQRKILAEAAKHGGANISVPEQMAEAANAHQFRVGDAVQTTYNGKSVRGVVVKVGKDALMIDIGSRKYDIAKHKDEVRYLPNVKIEPTLQDESVEEETVTEARKMGKRQLRKAVDDVFNKHFDGVPVPLMKLVAIYKEIEAAITSGADPDKAMGEIKKKHGIAEGVEVTEANDKIKLVKEMGSKTLYQYGFNYYIVSYSSMGGETAIFMADSSGKPKSYESLWSERRSVDHDSAIKDFVKYKFKKDAVVESTEIAEAPALMGGEAAPTIFGWGKHQFESKFRELLAKMGFERGIVHMKTEGKVMKIYFANAAKARDFVIAFNGIARRRSMDSVASVATQFDKIKAPTGTAAIVTLDLTMVRGENYEETLLSVMEEVSVEGTLTEGYERVILNYLEDAGFKKGDAWFENGILYVAKSNLIARAKTALKNKRDIYKLPEIRLEEGFVEMSEEDHGLRTDLTNPKGKAVVDGKGKVIAVYRTERAARKHAETGKPVKEEVEMEAYGNPFTPRVPGTFAAPNFRGGLKAGDKVKVPHKGKMVSGKIVRFDSGGTSKAQQHGGGYVVDVGEPASILVPAHKVVVEEVEVTGNNRLEESVTGGKFAKIVLFTRNRRNRKSTPKRFTVFFSRDPKDANTILVTSEAGTKKISLKEFVEWCDNYPTHMMLKNGKDHYSVDYSDGGYDYEWFIGPYWTNKFVGVNEDASYIWWYGNSQGLYPKAYPHPEWRKKMKQLAMGGVGESVEQVEVTESSIGSSWNFLSTVQTAKRRFDNFQYKKSSKTVSGDNTEFVLHGVTENQLRSIFGAPKSSGGMKQWSFEHDRPLDHQFTIEFDGSDAYINSSRKGNPTVRDHIKGVFGLMGLRVTTESVEEDGEELTEAQQVIGKYRFTSFTEGSVKGWLISVQGIGEIGFIEEPTKKNTKVSVAPHKVYFHRSWQGAGNPELMAFFYPGTETRVPNEKEVRFAPRQLLKAVAMWMDKYGYEKISYAKKEEVQVDENFNYGAYGYRIDPDGGKFVLYILSYNQGSVRFPDGRKGTVIGRFATKDEAIAKAKKDAMSRDPRLKEDINESVKPKLITPKEMADYKVKKVLAVGTKPNNESIVATCEWGKKKFVQLEKMGKTAGLNYIVQATFFDTEKEAMDEMRDRGFKIHD